ncbi:MAG: molybdopterin cofactor-binding domain-containing protein [Sphingomonadales bacterium]
MPAPQISRRSLLIGGGVGVGLVVGYTLWPRAYSPGLNTAPGEHALSGFVKVGNDGHVTIVVPQVELGHGVFTGLAQIVADELGADWRTVAVEAAQPGRTGSNTLLAHEWADGIGKSFWSFTPWPDDAAFAATGGSTSVRGFEARLRDAGAAARALLCSAAAKRWDADWQACDTHDGFVWHGDERMRFGEVAADAARIAVPSGIAWRTGSENRLVAQELPRLDLPSKVDGSVNFAADIRLPDMVYASIAEGPIGDARPKRANKAAAMRVTGVLDVVEEERWIAVVATNWWAADRGLQAAAPRFTVTGTPAGDRQIAKVLEGALDDPGTRLSAVGDVGAAFRGAQVLTQSYHAGLGAHAAVETASATALLKDGTLEIWTATQVPGLAAQAAARAIDLDVDEVVVHPMMVGGSFGARYETGIVGPAAVLAKKLGRPVQLIRSRAEEMRRDAFRAPAAARMTARVEPDGRIAAWFAQIAAPATLHEMQARLGEGLSAHDALDRAHGKAEPAAIAGAVPPYDIPVHAIDHHPASIGIPTGDWRGRAHVSNTFFRECFIDEIAHTTGNEPFGIRMGMLGGNPRLAQCLTKVAATGGWQGGVQGSNQGLACHSMVGSHIAVMVEARREGAQVKVDRIFAVADVGRIINPGIVRAQIIGGLVFGLSAAIGAPVTVERGMAGPARFGELRLPHMADCPKIEIELIISRDAPGGVGELSVPVVAPAIAGALFAATGARYRQLPLIQDV